MEIIKNNSTNQPQTNQPNQPNQPQSHHKKHSSLYSPIIQLTGHSDAVLSCKFSSNGSLIASGLIFIIKRWFRQLNHFMGFTNKQNYKKQRIKIT